MYFAFKISVTYTSPLHHTNPHKNGFLTQLIYVQFTQMFQARLSLSQTTQPVNLPCS